MYKVGQGVRGQTVKSKEELPDLYNIIEYIQYNRRKDNE